MRTLWGLLGAGLMTCLLGMGGCNAQILEPPGTGKPGASPAYAPPRAHLRRLTTTQYHNAVRDLFGDDLVLPTKLEPDFEIGGLLSVGASRTSVSARGVEQYEQAAYNIAEQAMEPGALRDRWVTCIPSGAADGDCATTVLAALGLRAWRRPLSPEEQDRLVELTVTAGTTLGDFYDGIEYGIAALLQSPYFLFRSELGLFDPETPRIRPYTNYEMASRLSFFLWNSIPDDELLAAAARGELTSDEGLRTQATRMLTSKRSRSGLRNFFSEMFELYKLDDLVKDPTIFTSMSPEVGPSAREETLLGLERLIFDDQGDYRDILTTDRTYLNRKLASIYNVQAPTREGFAEYQWNGDSKRSGLLGHASVLALHAHSVSSSATLRGKFVRKTLLCRIILPPPVDVDTSLPEPSGETLTLRDRVKEHLVNPSCAGCHQFMDPIGLAMETFDGIGRYRRTDNGAVIDPSGELDGYYFADSVDLAGLVRDHEDLGPCLVRTLFRYATGEVDSDGDRRTLAELGELFAAAQYRVLPLVLELVMHRGFRQGTRAPGGE